MDVSARRRLFKALVKAGWTIGRTGGDHLRIKTPTGDVVAYTGTTPSDQRGGRRLLADLRRAGWRWPPTARAGDRNAAERGQSPTERGRN